uniref:Uncharacterized protein n=1 Tax=Mycena chlorophos TaxID=658473 RepID=A0ABQ0KW71_MYCCL|nr:predicted protein [Mycena chlorophos]
MPPLSIGARAGATQSVFAGILPQEILVANLKRENSILQAEIVGPTIAVVSMLIALAGLAIWLSNRRIRAEDEEAQRRQKKIQQINLDPELETLENIPPIPGLVRGTVPIPEPSSSRGATITTVRTERQQDIAKEVNRTREQVAELVEEVRSTRSASLAASTSAGVNGRARRSAAGRMGSAAPSTREMELRLAEALQQIERLNARIGELESHARSSWALGETDVPPPGYYDGI